MFFIVIEVILIERTAVFKTVKAVIIEVFINFIYFLCCIANENLSHVGNRGLCGGELC